METAKYCIPSCEANEPGLKRIQDSYLPLFQDTRTCLSPLSQLVLVQITHLRTRTVSLRRFLLDSIRPSPCIRKDGANFLPNLHAFSFPPRHPRTTHQRRRRKRTMRKRHAYPCSSYIQLHATDHTYESSAICQDIEC